ncbi:Gag-Pro-Pol polyprotein, partial [Dictyocoela muelleri]
MINTNKSISLIDGSKLILSKKVFLDIEYKSRKLNLEFYVLKKSIMDIVLGCAAINKFMLNSEFPISCSIITRGNQIISWTRPIMNFKKKKIFQELVENLKSRGIIEPSTSLWCHPVVVVEKKDGNHRFTLDLTRLNNIVDLDRFT